MRALAGDDMRWHDLYLQRDSVSGALALDPRQLVLADPVGDTTRVGTNHHHHVVASLLKATMKYAIEYAAKSRKWTGNSAPRTLGILPRPYVTPFASSLAAVFALARP